MAVMATLIADMLKGFVEGLSRIDGVGSGAGFVDLKRK
jgi:hypothetical protein